MSSSNSFKYKFFKNLNLASGPSLPLPISFRWPGRLPFLTTYELRALNFLYIRIGRFVQQNSRRYSVLIVPQIRRRLHLALFLGLLRACLLWWQQVLFDPKSLFEKMVKRGSISGAWFMLAAIKGKAFARPQPVAQAPAAPGSCSPLELVIGTSTSRQFTMWGSNSHSSRHHWAIVTSIWHCCRWPVIRGCSEAASRSYWLCGELSSIIRVNFQKSWPWRCCQASQWTVQEVPYCEYSFSIASNNLKENALSKNMFLLDILRVRM